MFHSSGLEVQHRLLKGLVRYLTAAGNCGSQKRWYISTINSLWHSKEIIKSNRLSKNVSLERIIKRPMTLQNHSTSVPASVLAPIREMDDFMAVFPDLLRCLTETAKKHKCLEATDWFERVLQYNVQHGKRNRGILTVRAYKSLLKEKQLTADGIKLAQYLGWCIELLQGFFIICDDIIDNSTTRRGQPCWHKVKDVGSIAVNDGVMIENAIYEILKKYFSHLDCYIDLLELFHEISFITMCGQSLDILTSRKNVTEFTVESLKSMADNKTSYYTFYLPIASAMQLAGIKNVKVFHQTKSILLEIGEFFQMQDDFLDCFGNPKTTGKIGTDIQENKCTWLAVICMQRANKEQKAIMAECYGQRDPAKVQRVKDLYKELALPSIYATYEENSYVRIKKRIQQMSLEVPNNILFEILDMIYQRKS